MPKRVRDTEGLEVRAGKCSSCPFQTGENGRHLNEHLVADLQFQVLNECAHICHQNQVDKTAPIQLCRGARDFQLTIYHRMGFITEPSDEALKARTEELGRGKDS